MELAEIEAYATLKLPDELAMVQAGGFCTACSRWLKPCEKAVIYAYTCPDDPAKEHTYSKLKAQLHANRGINTSQWGKSIAAALDKLPPFKRNVRSAVHLTAQELMGFQKNATFTWPAFLSTTTSPEIANNFLSYGTPNQPKNAMFFIRSRTGRLIETLSFFGPNGEGDSEFEVLFKPGTRFRVSERTDNNTKTGVIEFVLEELI